MVGAIRESDPNTPIILDGWFYADPGGFRYNIPIADQRTLYALHNLGPVGLHDISRKQGAFCIPEPDAGKERRRGAMDDR